MASKKKATKKSLGQTVAFNKENTLALADTIFSDKGGVVSLLKLCGGDLSNGKDGGRTLHCAVGEAYFQFVSKDMRSVLNAKPSKEDKEDGVVDYQPKYGESEGPTGATIDALVEAAVLKNPTEANKRKLAVALDSAVETNDDSCENELGAFIERSKNVAEVFRKKIAPLLK